MAPAAAQARLLAASQNQLDVQVVANPASGLRVLQLVIAVSVVILAVIGLANLLTATWSGCGTTGTRWVCWRLWASRRVR